MNWKVKGTMAGITVAMTLAMLSATAIAGPLAPEERAFRGKTEVMDASLADMRGRFISADQIVYFGVEMYTSWNTAAGEQVGAAALNIGIDRSNSRARPTVNVSSNVQTPNAASGNGNAAASASQSSGRGLNQVQGVSQLVQVTGNGNRVTNSADVCVGNQCTAVAALGGAGGNNSIANPQTGATAQSFVTSTGAGVSVAVVNQGTASQSIAGITGIQQRAQVSGDALSIHNQLNMVIQLQTNSAAATASMNNLSQTMRGLWQAGIH
jgi:hypothetical protein